MARICATRDRCTCPRYPKGPLFSPSASSQRQMIHSSSIFASGVAASEGSIVAAKLRCFAIIIAIILFCAAFPASLLFWPALSAPACFVRFTGQRSGSPFSIELIVTRTPSSIVQPASTGDLFSDCTGTPLVALLAAAPTLVAPSTRALTNRRSHFRPLEARALAPPCPSSPPWASSDSSVAPWSDLCSYKATSRPRTDPLISPLPLESSGP
mmetsp:Transcript_11499/g.25663  ORF Transcript_11499/g.25663 Transcript_11499/m.25663 type:complete len:212 (+) Transcript_11499:3343-3978(+)